MPETSQRFSRRLSAAIPPEYAPREPHPEGTPAGDASPGQAVKEHRGQTLPTLSVDTPTSNTFPVWLNLAPNPASDDSKHNVAGQNYRSLAFTVSKTELFEPLKKRVGGSLSKLSSLLLLEMLRRIALMLQGSKRPLPKEIGRGKIKTHSSQPLHALTHAMENLAVASPQFDCDVALLQWYFYGANGVFGLPGVHG